MFIKSVNATNHGAELVHNYIKCTLHHAVKLELRGFSDAKLKAMAAVIYLRFVLSNGCVFTNLVAAKTKITPLGNKFTVPKLKLVGCFLLSKLIKTVKQSLETDIFCWTNALDCVYWINNSS